ncbi:helix-turn-helix domain-containing protein [Treponema sp. R6D11]
MTVQELNILVGENIRYYRKLKGWYVRKLAEKIGTSETTVSNHEHGHVMPSTKYLLLYALVFNIEVHQLYTREQTKIAIRTTGERIKYYREKKGLSQRELSKKMGITPSFVCACEHGEYMPTLDRLKQYADVLDVEVREIRA